MILLIAPYPPPIGGVSVHVQRVADLCVASGMGVEVLSLYGGKAIDQDPSFVRRLGGPLWKRAIALGPAIRRSPAKIIHVHASAMARLAWLGPIILKASRGRPLVVTVNSGSWPPDSEDSLDGISGRLLSRFLRRADRIITVNGRQAEAVIEKMRVDPTRVSTIPAYLPAPSGSPMDPATREWIARERTHGRRILLTSGYGTPLYGYEDIGEAIRGTGDDIEFALILMTYNVHDEDYVSRLDAQFADLPIRWIRDQPPAVFQAVLAECDCYVRATSHDGDSVAVREAQALRTPVLASDAVPRPPGVVTYPAGDPQALREALDHLGGPVEREPVIDTTESWNKLSAIYRDLGAFKDTGQAHDQ